MAVHAAGRPRQVIAGAALSLLQAGSNGGGGMTPGMVSVSDGGGDMVAVAAAVMCVRTSDGHQCCPFWPCCPHFTHM